MSGGRSVFNTSRNKIDNSFSKNNNFDSNKKSQDETNVIEDELD